MTKFYATVDGRMPRFGWCGRCLQPNEGTSARTATCSGCHLPPPQCSCREARRRELLAQELDESCIREFLDGGISVHVAPAREPG